MILEGEIASQQQNPPSNPSTMQKTLSNLIVSEKTPLKTQPNVEIIPTNHTFEIFLNIKEIPPMDIFYIPIHKATVKRGRKKRKLDET